MNSIVSVCFTSMKLRYASYNMSIDALNFVKVGDKINVFINFESILNNISTIKDLHEKLVLEPKFDLMLESEILNLIAHYKRFFRDHKLDTNVYLYYTDLESESFNSFKYNDEYRMYYITKYKQNPKFQFLGEQLISSIIPRVKKIVEFIPNVYFIVSKNIESSLIPGIISSMDNRKNFIISSDKYDTQYQLENTKFCNHYIKKSPKGVRVSYKFMTTIQNMFEDNKLSTEYLELFSNPSMYSLLLAINGDRIRSIEPVKRLGPKTLLKYIVQNINSGNINKNTTSIDLLMNIIPEEYRDNVLNNYNMININKQIMELSEADIYSITSQITDRFDLNSLIELNRTTYNDFPLMLPELVN